MAQIKIPYLNPMFYTEVGFTQDSHYASKHMDDFQFRDTIRPWEQQMCFGSIWAPADVIRHRVISAVGPVNIKLVDADDTSIVFDTQAFVQKWQNADIPGEYYYDNDYDISGAEKEKRYRFLLTFGSPVQKTYVSEPFLLSENIENTLYLQYSHYKHRGEMIFEDGLVFYKRLYGCLVSDESASKDTFWEDQELNQEIINSSPYELFELYLSDEYGIPPYFRKRMNWILGCSELLIDGRFYTKADGSKLEKSALENYPMSGYKISMRERLNRSAMVTITEGNPNSRLAVVITVDLKGISTDTSGLQTQITDVE